MGVVEERADRVQAGVHEGRHEGVLLRLRHRPSVPGPRRYPPPSAAHEVVDRLGDLRDRPLNALGAARRRSAGRPAGPRRRSGRPSPRCHPPRRSGRAPAARVAPGGARSWAAAARGVLGVRPPVATVRRVGPGLRRGLGAVVARAAARGRGGRGRLLPRAVVGVVGRPVPEPARRSLRRRAAVRLLSLRFCSLLRLAATGRGRRPRAAPDGLRGDLARLGAPSPGRSAAAVVVVRAADLRADARSEAGDDHRRDRGELGAAGGGMVGDEGSWPSQLVARAAATAAERSSGNGNSAATFSTARSRSGRRGTAAGSTTPAASASRRHGWQWETWRASRRVSRAPRRPLPALAMIDWMRTQRCPEASSSYSSVSRRRARNSVLSTAGRLMPMRSPISR